MATEAWVSLWGRKIGAVALGDGEDFELILGVPTEQAERLLDDVIMLKKGEAVVQGTLAEVRARFGSDWVQVRGEGSAQALSSMQEVADLSNKPEYSRLRPADGYQARDVLEQLVKTDCEIREFTMVEPSLKEIFLYKIGDLEVDGLVDREVTS